MKKRNYLSYNDAKESVRSLGLKSQKECNMNIILI